MRRLFEAHELKALASKPVEHWGQTAVHLDFNSLRAVASDPTVDPGGSAGDHPPDTETAAGSYDMREIHMASHRRAGHDQPAGRSGNLGRLVPDVLES